MNFSFIDIISNISFNAEFINTSAIQAMWIPDETVMTYIVNCTLGECEPSFLHHNESHVIFEVKKLLYAKCMFNS